MTILILRKTDFCVLSLKLAFDLGSLSNNREVLGDTSPNESLPTFFS